VTSDSLLAAADRCVKCGLCLPHCPTYELFRSEAESPRGRIALIQGLLEGGLEDSPELRTHLDHCLLCRNCERACPSQVEYGELMDGVRARLAAGSRPGLILTTLTNPSRLKGLAGVNALLKPLGIRRLLPEQQSRMAGWLGGRRSVRAKPMAPAVTGGGQRVALFTGCVSRVTDSAVIEASRRILEYLGCVVEIPRDQGCCGAMHLHQGFSRDAEGFRVRNRAVFQVLDVSAVLTVASGCGAELLEHGGFDVPVRDVGAFLAQLDWPREVLDAMPAATVALHQPCSLRNVMRQEDGVAGLLGLFAGLEVVPLEAGGCCGGAGMQLVDEPEMAAALAAPLIDQLRDSDVRVLLTSSTGCALNLAAAVERAGLSVRVHHPVEFIAEQLGI